MAALVSFALSYAPNIGPRLTLPATSRAAVSAGAPVGVDGDLQTFLLEEAGIHPKYLERLLAICDDEMIGSVANLQTANELGLIRSLFKPMVALSIESALGGTIDVSESASQIKEMLQADLASAGAYAAPLAVASNDLEVEPYWDMLPNLPMNTFKPKAPHTAAIASVKRIVGVHAPGEVCHVTINTAGALRYWEGQSLGVVPPGVNPKTGKPNAVRLYSIASTRYGDDGAANTVSLCVRRAVYWDKELGREDPAKKGVCSNFLCDAKAGDPVSVTGPTGKVMLMPEANPSADLIMVATGTGIAPYRGFLRRLFGEDTPAKAAFQGLAWLFLGVPVTDGLLYADEWAAARERHPDHFRVTYAISREQTDVNGHKMYVQSRLAEHAEELFTRLDNGAHIYFCGLKGMMPGIIETLAEVAAGKGVSWDDKLKLLKKNGQWHVEVY